MIKRIVKMTFRADAIETFLHIFDSGCREIRASKGCHYLELLQDRKDPRIFFTLSIWEHETDLDAYRRSDLFRRTWTATKLLFDAEPNAWTTDSYRRIE